MILDSHFWPLTLLFAAISTGLFGLIAITGTTTRKAIIGGAIGTFIAALFLSRFVMYYYQPTFQGSFGGYFELIFCALLPATVLGLMLNNVPGKTILAAGATWLVFVTVPMVQYGYNAWGSGNAARFAAQAKIRVASKDEKIPPTDPKKMVLVTKSIAAFKGATALTTQGNLNSTYMIDPNSYVLQAVNGRRYWIAPLQFANTGDSWNFGEPKSPGYVVVDAMDQNKEAVLKLDYQMTLFASGSFGLNLERFVYQHGYTDGLLIDAKFEVDDNWAPHWIMTYAKRPFGEITGREIEKVIVVDVSTATPKLTAYKISEQPEWIERVMPESLIKEYVDNWGIWGGEYARSNYWSVAFGWRKDGTMQAADYDLNYTTDNHSVEVIPMTSTRSGQHAVSGVLVYETTDNEAVYYPGLNGFNVGESVQETMLHAPQNVKNYPVENVQLYSIYGELTWVAIYTSNQAVGRSFAGIGMLHAHGQNSAEGIFAPDLNRALTLYANQLAQKRMAGGNISQAAEKSHQINGVIKAIAYLPINQNLPTYLFMIEGDNRTFILTRETYAKAPLVEKGQHVTFTYLDTGSDELATGNFSATELEVKK